LAAKRSAVVGAPEGSTLPPLLPVLGPDRGLAGGVEGGIELPCVGLLAG
jgi:hypothetical protein